MAGQMEIGLGYKCDVIDLKKPFSLSPDQRGEPWTCIWAERVVLIRCPAMFNLWCCANAGDSRLLLAR